MKETINFDALMRANLARVFGERDVGRRRAALEELYTADAKLYEPDSVSTGRDAICGAVEALIARLPPKLVFTPVGIAVGHHGLGRLAWRAAPRRRCRRYRHGCCPSRGGTDQVTARPP